MGEPHVWAPLRMAHRGAPQLRAENSVPSFVAAAAAGADVLEMDVRATRDDVLVVLHDASLARTTGVARAVRDCTWAEVRRLPLIEPPAARLAGPGAAQATVPTLEQVLCAVPSASFNIDAKDLRPHQLDALLALLAQQAERLGRYPDVRLTSSSSAAQRQLDATAPRALARGMGRRDVLEVLVAAHVRLPPIERLRGRAFQAPMRQRVAGVSVPVVTPRVVAYLREMGCPVHVWWQDDAMVDSPERLAACRSLGVDGVFTNAIEAMAPALSSAP